MKRGLVHSLRASACVAQHWAKKDDFLAEHNEVARLKVPTFSLLLF